MKMQTGLRYVLLIGLMIGLGAFVGVISADDHDEAVDGPVSGDGLNPTALNGTLGDNIIDGSVANFPDVRYFSITVPDGMQISAINHIEDQGGDGGNWFAIMSGPQFTENSTNSGDINTDNMLGNAVIGNRFGGVPQNVMSRMGLPETLPPGTYSFRIQNWGSGFNFAFNIELTEASVTAVSLTSTHSSTPQATALILLLSGMLLTISMRTIHRGAGIPGRQPLP